MIARQILRCAAQVDGQQHMLLFLKLRAAVSLLLSNVATGILPALRVLQGLLICNTDL